MEEEHIDESGENSALLANENHCNTAVTSNTGDAAWWKDWKIYNVVLLGLAFMFLFTAFQTCSMVETLVLDGAHIESNNTFDGSGYTSLAIIYGVMGVSNWLAPSIVAVLTAKWSMLAGGITYCIFIAAFIKPMTILLYISSALVGLGAAVLWTAQGNCLTVNSDSSTMSRNIGIFWALFESSILIGNLYMYFNFTGVKIITSSTRKPMFIVLTILGVIGTLMFSLIRKLSADQDPEVRRRSLLVRTYGPWQAFKTSIRLFFNKEMVLLSVFFAYLGFEQSFWAAVYGTSIGRTQSFGDFAKQLTGLCGIFIGIGEILGAIVLGLLSSKLKIIKRDFVVYIAYVIHVTCFYLVYLNLPAESPLHDTDELPYITPDKYLAIVCAFLLGLGDSLFNNQVYGIIGALYPDDSAPAFALFKFVQSLASAGAFVYSQVLFLHWQLLILIITGTAGSVLFFTVDSWARERASERECLVNSEKDDESDN